MCHPQQVVAAGPARLQGGGVEQGSHMIQRVAEASIRLSANQCTSRIRRIQPQDHAHRGRLSRAIGSHEAGSMTWRDDKVQPAEAHSYVGELALSSLIVGLCALATVLPVLVFCAHSAAAGVAVTRASLVSLTTFQTLTVAGAAAQIIAGYRLGRHGSPLLAVLLA